MPSCWSCSSTVSGSGDFCRACGSRTTWRGWNLARSLGSGGNGAAYLVEKQQQRAVLKLPSASVTAREHQIECRNLYLAASLGVAPAPLETADDGILMEYLPAPTGMSIKERALQLCAGINKLHNRGLIHRDIKPENIIGWRLIDLGAMVALSLDGVDGPLTPIGTPGYAPPEAYRKQVSHKLDAYATGWVIISWLGGPEPDEDPRTAGIFPTWNIPADPSVNWDELLHGLLEANPTKRVSVGLALNKLQGAWCTLPDGTQIASDLVTVEQWKQILPAPCRSTAGYATELAAPDRQRYLSLTQTRLPYRAELEALAIGTLRQPLLRSHDAVLNEGLVSDLGARNCRRFLWQLTQEGLLWGGTPYADQESIPAPAQPNAMIGLRVVKQ